VRSGKEERGKRKEERGKRKEERGKRETRAKTEKAEPGGE
jgi:division protein 1